MTAPLRIDWLGRLPYPEAHARMVERLERRLAGDEPDSLLLLEHEPVFTVGRQRGAADSVLDPGDIPVIPVERGGNVTYHGPGQLVGYPIVALPPHRQDIHGYLRGLEDMLIGLLAGYGIAGARDPRNTGVWVGGQKICALGVAVRRWVTWHGFSVNLDPALDAYRRIHPCGMDSTLVTRVVDHAAAPPQLSALRDATATAFRAWWERFAAPPADGGPGPG
jgi:lipoyl(octanoyl) transferase